MHIHYMLQSYRPGMCLAFYIDILYMYLFMWTCFTVVWLLLFPCFCVSHSQRITVCCQVIQRDTYKIAFCYQNICRVHTFLQFQLSSQTKHRPTATNFEYGAHSVQFHIALNSNLQCWYDGDGAYRIRSAILSAICVRFHHKMIFTFLFMVFHFIISEIT